MGPSLGVSINTLSKLSSAYSFFKIFISSFHAYEGFAYTYVSALRVCLVPPEARRGPWNGSQGQL